MDPPLSPTPRSEILQLHIQDIKCFTMPIPRVLILDRAVLKLNMFSVSSSSS